MSGLKHLAEVLVKVESASYHKLTARLRMNRVIFQEEIIPPFLSFHHRGTEPQPALCIWSESPRPPPAAMHTQASLRPFNRAQVKALTTQAVALRHHLGEWGSSCWEAVLFTPRSLLSEVAGKPILWNPVSCILILFLFFLVTASAASVVRVL